MNAKLKISEIADRSIADDEMRMLPGGGNEVCQTSRCTPQTWDESYDESEDKLYVALQEATRVEPKT